METTGALVTAKLRPIDLNATGREPRRNPARRMARVLLVILFVGGITGLSASWWMAGRLIAPAPSGRPRVPTELDATAFVIKDAQGREVHGWRVPAAPAKSATRQRPGGSGVVVLLHGIHGNRTAMVGRARFLAREGFAAVLVDLHAHGESGGERITLGDQERFTARAAVRYAREWMPALPVAVIGVSLGGAAATLASPLDVDAIILESVYPDIDSAVEHRVAARLGGLTALSRVPTWLLLAQIEPRLGVSRSALRPVDRVGDVGCPLLIASGTKDPYTPPADARRLFGAALEPKAIWLVEGAGHVDLHQAVQTDYERRVLRFLEEALSSVGGARPKQRGASGASIPELGPPPRKPK